MRLGDPKVLEPLVYLATPATCKKVSSFSKYINNNIVDNIKIENIFNKKYFITGSRQVTSIKPRTKREG